MNNKNEIMPTNEIVGAILQTYANDEDLDRFKSSPSGFLQERGVDLMTAEVGVVENEPAMVHLCLPYYESFGKEVANAIADDKLSYVSGGELLIVTATVGAGVATLGVIALASSFGYVYGTSDDAKKK